MTQQVNFGGAHLTTEQMSDLLGTLAVRPEDPRADEEAEGRAGAEAHLRGCPRCAAELNSLRDALAVFQQASVVHADRIYSRLAHPITSLPESRRSYPQGLFWVAASTILMAGMLPVEMRWHKGAKAAPMLSVTSAARAESDEALLEEVDREVSLSVPAPMQVLVEPTDDPSSDLQSSKLLTQTQTQRKN